MRVLVTPHISPSFGNPSPIAHASGTWYSTSVKRKNPQLTATVSEAQYALLRRLSELSGQSVSSIVAELLGAATPALQAVIEAMDTAKTKREDVPFIIQGLLTKASADLGEVQADMGQVWDEVRRVRNLP